MTRRWFGVGLSLGETLLEMGFSDIRPILGHQREAQGLWHVWSPGEPAPKGLEIIGYDVLKGSETHDAVIALSRARTAPPDDID